MLRLPLAACAALMLATPALGDYRAGVQAWGRADYARAAAAFRPDAEAGDAESQYMLGRLYALGDGVPRDFVQAWRWFDRAARQGHAPAAEARHVLDGVLPPEQLARLIAPPPPPPPPAPSPPTVTVPADSPRPMLLVPRRGAVDIPDQQQAAR